MTTKKTQTAGTTYRSLQWLAIRAQSAEAFKKHFAEAKSFITELPAEHRETGRRILDAAWYAGCWAERAKQAPWLANAKLQELTGKMGSKGGRPQGSNPEDDLEGLAEMTGAQRANAIADVARGRGIKPDSVRRAVSRWKKRQERKIVGQ